MLTALVDNQRIVGPDIPIDDWKELKSKNKKKKTSITMRCCGAKGHPRTSKNGLQHFYHAPGSPPCNWEHESLTHLEIKNEIYQICKAANWNTNVEYISEEGDWRADVFAQNDDKRIVFEVQLTKIPLDTLKERDAKYRREGIESYWILKNKISYRLRDYREFESDSEFIPYIDSFFSNEPGCQNPNKFDFFLPKDVISVDLNIDKRQIHQEDNEITSINEWINSILNGTFQSKLLKNREEYDSILSLREVAKPILEEVDESHQKIFSLIHELDRQYAIFKENSFDNSVCIKENFSICYEMKKEMTKYFFGTVLSKGLGWKWIRSRYSIHIDQVLQLQSVDQLFEIQRLSHEAIKKIDVFEKQLKNIKNNIQSTRKNELPKVTDQKRNTSPTQRITTPTFQIPPYSSEKNNRSVPKERKSTDISKNPSEEIVKFEVNLDLPTNWLVGPDGHQYQVIPGLPVGLMINVAKEFEKKGYGRIIQKWDDSIS